MGNPLLKIKRSVKGDYISRMVNFKPIAVSRIPVTKLTDEFQSCISSSHAESNSFGFFRVTESWHLITMTSSSLKCSPRADMRFCKVSSKARLILEIYKDLDINVRVSFLKIVKALKISLRSDSLAILPNRTVLSIGSLGVEHSTDQSIISLSRATFLSRFSLASSLFLRLSCCFTFCWTSVKVAAASIRVPQATSELDKSLKPDIGYMTNNMIINNRVEETKKYTNFIFKLYHNI